MAGAIAAMQVPTIVGANILNGALGQPMQYHVQASFTPAAFEAEDLPEGLTLDPILGILSGTPASGGVYSPLIRAIGPEGEIAEVILTISVEGAEETIFNNHNIYGVQSNPTNPTQFTIDAPVLVTFLEDYHYFNNGALPGTIALRHEDGTLYGPWQTTGRVGQGNVPNAYWECAPMVTIKAGTYEVIDSDPSTCRKTSHSNNAGLTIVKGKAGGTTHRPVYDSWANNQDLSGSNADPNADPGLLASAVRTGLSSVREAIPWWRISSPRSGGERGWRREYLDDPAQWRYRHPGRLYRQRRSIPLVAATGLGATNWVSSAGWVQNTEAEVVGFRRRPQPGKAPARRHARPRGGVVLPLGHVQPDRLIQLQRASA